MRNFLATLIVLVGLAILSFTAWKMNAPSVMWCVIPLFIFAYYMADMKGFAETAAKLIPDEPKKIYPFTWDDKVYADIEHVTDAVLAKVRMMIEDEPIIVDKDDHIYAPVITVTLRKSSEIIQTNRTGKDTGSGTDRGPISDGDSAAADGSSSTQLTQHTAAHSNTIGDAASAIV